MFESPASLSFSICFSLFVSFFLSFLFLSLSLSVSLFLSSPPDLLNFENLKNWKCSNSVFDLIGLLSQLRAYTVNVAASGVNFDVGSLIF